eukprot:TRINITY_DN8537_c0_g1_i4.p1 TRINITY_DN8537_c0_g1~~TRINITY_DN8537_c0_g1_i4.p1  ORF type:complete len:844 (-),score=128.89 TRINITY_DN8537_c0_g1_i4:270-2801(-)
MGSSSKEAKSSMETGKYVRYTAEQVEALERVYSECPKPSSLRRQQLIRECPILSNIEPKQIKVWFQNRRCREKQRKEASRLQTVNRKLTAMNKLLMEENDRLQKQVSHLVYENGYMRQQLQNASVAGTDTSCESVVTSGQHQPNPNPTPQHPPRDASPAGLLSIAEETLTVFLSKAKGAAVDWVQMPGMKPGPDSIGIVAISNTCNGVAARACGLVGLEPTKVAEILKDRPSWLRDCRCLEVMTAYPTANGGTIEVLYMQTYAPTINLSARDFWTVRYTTVLDDASLVVCERSLTSTLAGQVLPAVPNFVRAEMLPSGYIIQPCEGGGSIIRIVDHFDLEPWSVPEVLRPLYESSTILAQKMTIAAMRRLRQIAQETTGEVVFGWGRQPAALRTFSQRLSRVFNEAVNGFADDGWSLLSSDGGVEDVTIAINSSPSKHVGLTNAFSGYGTAGVLCAKSSMLLQNVPPALLIRFLREHRSEWADSGIDAYSAAALKSNPYNIPGTRAGSFTGSQVILPLAHTVENEEFLEVIKLDGHGLAHEDVLSRDMFLLQLCSGIDESAAGGCAELIFAPIDESFADDAPLLPSGFRVIPLESRSDCTGSGGVNRTLDLASALDVRSNGSRVAGDSGVNSNLRSVLTIAFQFTYENHLRENVAAMARQYVRSVAASVQRVAMALSPSRIGLQIGQKPPPGSPEAVTLARWICQSYRLHVGVDLLRSDCEVGESVLKHLWNHPEAIIYCSLKVQSMPVFTFANQAGLDMLETTLVALQDISLDKILNESGSKSLFADFPQIMQQGYASLPAGICVSSMGRPVSYDRAIAWKVVNDENITHCMVLMFMNWSFV